MAKYNIYGHVLYSEIEYEKLMYETERIFIRALMNRLPSIAEWTEGIWNNIDHEYMIQTLEEIKKDIINTDAAILLKYKNTSIDLEKIIEITENIENIFEITPVDKFKEYEKYFGERVAKFYKKKIDYLETNEWVDDTEYLTKQIEEYKEINNFVKYQGKTIRYVDIGTYLSMLYNVNLTRTGWNQTFKDAEYLERDLVLLETHPRSCPLCAPMQRKSLFINWEIKIPKYTSSV